jgi:hypothetical protein
MVLLNSKEVRFVRVVGFLMRIFGVVFHVLLGIVMLAVSSVALLSQAHNLHIQVLPWQGAALTWWLFGAGLASIVLALLAFRRILPILFVLWSLAVFIMLVRGYLLTGYSFAFGGGFSSALLLIAGALLAVVGSLLQVRQGIRQYKHSSAVA